MPQKTATPVKTEPKIEPPVYPEMEPEKICPSQKEEVVRRVREG